MATETARRAFQDIPNPQYYLASGYLNLGAMARASAVILHVSTYKTTLAGPPLAGAECQLRIIDDGNQTRASPSTRWRVIGSDHAGAKVLLERL